MFRDFYALADELHEAIKKIRNVWIPFTPKMKKSGMETRGKYMITDDGVVHVSVSILFSQGIGINTNFPFNEKK